MVKTFKVYLGQVLDPFILSGPFNLSSSHDNSLSVSAIITRSRNNSSRKTSCSYGEQNDAYYYSSTSTSATTPLLGSANHHNHHHHHRGPQSNHASGSNSLSSSPKTTTSLTPPEMTSNLSSGSSPPPSSSSPASSPGATATTAGACYNMIKYSCMHCQANLARHDDLISKSFQGSQGRAYLFQNVVNVKCSRLEDRTLLTGLHTVCDISCQCCQTLLGWKYERAYEPSQKYKEGKYIIELAHLMKDNCWEVASSSSSDESWLQSPNTSNRSSGCFFD